MRLRDLRPKLEGSLGDGVLRFDCPLGHGHKLRVPLGTGGWSATGAFPDSLTVRPSVNADTLGTDGQPLCGWHGYITEGAIQ